MKFNFACKQFNLKDVIKCGLNITKSDYNLFMYMADKEDWFTTDTLSKELNLNISTIQRGVKKLHEKNIIRRRQQNIEGGGYFFLYQIQERQIIKKTILKIINGWVRRVEDEFDNWCCRE